MKVPEPRKLPSGNYFIQMRLNGVSVPVTAPTAKECVTQAQLIKAEHRAGKRQIQQTSNITLSQAIDNYILARKNILSPSTIRGYRMIQKNRFKDEMEKPLFKISDWQTICNKEAKLCSAKTLHNAWGFITSVLKENKIEVPKINLPQIIAKEYKWLEPDQIKIFLKAIENQPCELGALFALHSLRRSEIFALTWDSIDLKKGCIYVQGSVVLDENAKMTRKNTNKNKTSRRVVPIIIPRLNAILKEMSTETTPLIKCNINTLGEQINKICKKQNLPEVGVHGLRHSFASLAYHLNVPEKECMLIGGWANSQTMHKIYTHLSANDINKYTNMMANFYAE